jgi:hypothetical protein
MFSSSAIAARKGKTQQQGVSYALTEVVKRGMLITTFHLVRNWRNYTGKYQREHEIARNIQP